MIDKHELMLWLERIKDDWTMLAINHSANNNKDGAKKSMERRQCLIDLIDAADEKWGPK